MNYSRIVSGALAAIAVGFSVAAPPVHAATTATAYKKGSLVPLQISVQGSLIESEQTSEIYLRAKQDLWVRVSENKVELSHDGRNFKAFTEMVSGTLQVGVQPNQGVTIEIDLEKRD